MSRVKTWSLSLLLLVIAAVPVIAGSNDGKPANDGAANTPVEATSVAANPNLAPTAADANVTALLGVLVMKGVLAPNEANAIRNAAPDVKFKLLVDALNRKGILNAADVSAATNATPAPAPAAQPAPVPAPANPRPVVEASLGDPSPAPAATPMPDAPPPPAVVPAIAPLRVLPVDPPKKDGLNAAFKMGGVKMTPYGFIKATAARDSSDPNGDDFPFIGLFLTAAGADTLTTGPTQDPEFHIKARSTRIGANFEWPDISPRLTFTGRIEGDYEGNFSEADNRDVSSIRSNAFQLRLAWARMDYAASDRTDLYFEGGQDWTLFGSSVLPALLETTFLGAYYGDVYERSPQFQFGLVQKVGASVKISPTFAIMMPSSGQILKLGSVGLAGQLGEGEREGADSGRPEVEARLAVQFPLDKAPGVAPAQILWSGFQSRRTSIVAKENYAACVSAFCATYEAAFPNGFTDSSTQYGNQLAIQLPTRWATLVASGYFGGDLRFFFGGQVDSYYTDVTGLSNPVTFTTTDGGPLAAAGGAVLATNSAGNVVIAPQRPIRAFGGFVNLGLPLSRWFNANPKGHNAGWQLYFHAGKDQVVKNDLVQATGSGGLPLLMGKVFAATLYYKVNPYVTFGFEQSVYGTRLGQGAGTNCAVGPCYDIAGSPDDLWQDHRTEFGPIFTF
jgi:hypothetical protein